MTIVGKTIALKCGVRSTIETRPFVGPRWQSLITDRSLTATVLLLIDNDAVFVTVSQCYGRTIALRKLISQ